MEMVKIKFIRPTIFRKQQVMPSDEPIEVTRKEAVEMIGAGKAVFVKEPAVETTDLPMDEVEISSAPEAPGVPDVEEEKPKPSGKKKKAS